MTGKQGPSYTFSYDVDSFTHTLSEEPTHTPAETIPVEIFKHASAVQSLSRFLVDTRRLSFADTGRLLGRSPKSIWGSYHQTKALPKIKDSKINIPVNIFLDRLSPLEAICTFLQSLGLRNIEIAEILDRDPRTTHTALRRGEVKR